MKEDDLKQNKIFLTPARLAKEIQKLDSFAQDPGGTLFRFKGGRYIPDGERYVASRVKAIFTHYRQSDGWKSTCAKEATQFILADAPELWSSLPKDTINVQNGLLDIVTRELKPHHKGFLSPIQLPVRYDRSAGCPFWDAFISDTFPKDAQSLAYEIIAWLIDSANMTQTAVLLLGEGANGKSVFLQAVTVFLGPENISGVSLHKLEADRFAAARLVGKLANICPDLPDAKLASNSVFKTITGGDRLLAERKYKDSFEFVPFVKLVFSANNPPKTDDASYGFFRRWLFITFPNTFEASDPNTIPRADLDAALASPDQLSGVLNKVLDLLPRVREKGFSLSPSMAETREEYEAAANPFMIWLSHRVVDAPGKYVEKSALYDRYLDDMDKSTTKQLFGKLLKRARPDLKHGQRQIVGKVREVYLDISWRV